MIPQLFTSKIHILFYVIKFASVNKEILEKISIDVSRNFTNIRNYF